MTRENGPKSTPVDGSSLVAAAMLPALASTPSLTPPPSSLRPPRAVACFCMCNRASRPPNGAAPSAPGTLWGWHTPCQWCGHGTRPSILRLSLHHPRPDLGPWVAFKGKPGAQAAQGAAQPAQRAPPVVRRRQTLRRDVRLLPMASLLAWKLPGMSLYFEINFEHVVNCKRLVRSLNKADSTCTDGPAGQWP